MKKLFSIFTVAATLLLGMFTSCDEVSEAGEYDNWTVRNQQFVDSLHTLVGSNVVTTLEEADAMPLQKHFAVEVPVSSTTAGKAYVYCQKLVSNPDGERPLYAGHNSTVSAFYYGTLITGDMFDGNFTGFSATDKDVSNIEEKQPTSSDEPVDFNVKSVIAGWTWPLQYMHEGERWIVYIPQECAYGTDDNGSIPGYSALTFDIILDDVK